MRNHDGHAALLVGTCTELPLTIHVILEGGDGKKVAIHVADRVEKLLDLLDDGRATLEREGAGGILGGCPVCGDVDLGIGGGAGIDGLMVGIDDGLTLLHVGLGGGVLHVLKGLLGRKDLRQREERGLQDGVGALAHADLLGQIDGIDHVDLDVIAGDVALCLGVKLLGELVEVPLGVDQERAAGLDILDDVHALGDVAGVVARDEVRLGDIVRRTNRGVAETQVRDRDATGLLGIVLEVGLDVLVGVVTDDLDRVLVGADGTVATETPELALDGTGGSGVGVVLARKGESGDVIDDADRELALGSVLGQLGIHGEGVCRRGVLRAKTVTATRDDEVGLARLVESGDDVLIERLADGTRLLGAVEDGNLLDGRGKGGHEVLDRPGTIQADLHEADLLAIGVEVVDDLLEGVAEGAHADDHAVGVCRAVVVEQVVAGAELLVDLVHVALDDLRESVIGGVAGLTMLEEDVAVLVGTTGMRVLGVEGVVAERLDGIHVEHVGKVVEVPGRNLLDLVGGAEAVEEVQERYLALDGGEMGHRREVHDLLHVALGEHGKAGLTAGHDVGVVTEDVEGVRRDRTRGHVKDAWQTLSGDLVHVRNHEEQTLRCRIGGRKGTGTERAVNGSGCASLGFHLDDVDGITEDVLQTLGRPLVNVIGHGARRRDRVDARNLGVGIGDPRCGLVAVHGLKLSRHILSFRHADRRSSTAPQIVSQPCTPSRRMPRHLDDTPSIRVDGASGMLYQSKHKDRPQMCRDARASADARSFS